MMKCIFYNFMGMIDFIYFIYTAYFFSIFVYSKVTCRMKQRLLL